MLGHLPELPLPLEAPICVFFPGAHPWDTQSPAALGPAVMELGAGPAPILLYLPSRIRALILIPALSV